MQLYINTFDQRKKFKELKLSPNSKKTGVAEEIKRKRKICCRKKSKTSDY